MMQPSNYLNFLKSQDRLTRKKSLATRLSFVVVIIVLTCVAAISVLTYFMYRANSIEYHAEKARSTAVAIASFIDGDMLAVSMQSETEDAYWHIVQAQLNSTLVGIPEVTFAYIMWPYNNTQFQYFASGYRPGGAPYVGFRYVEDPEMYAEETWDVIRYGISITTGIEYAGFYGHLISGFAPVFDSSDNAIAIVGVDFDAGRVQIQAFRFIIVIILTGVVTILIVGIFFTKYVSDLVSKPLAPLVEFLGRASVTGDFRLKEEELAIISRCKENKYEPGEIATAVVSLMEEILREMEAMERIAGGDVSFSPTVLSENDTIGLSLTKVVDSLNAVLAEINAMANQVSSNTEQISSGTQMLAQGSTEQAATIEEISASTSEISLRIKEGAEMAAKAAELANAIKSNAEKGSRQMDDMVTAVEEISRSSQSISKIIKVIDDIAFQTNILALNAAVEAARAGQHGKGFAVVAEEVRALAAKSAEAAKDTGSLISDSMEKAAVGAKIATETAGSLAEIVTGMNESSEVISEIALASETQSASITHINQGIDQIADVVQNNSATTQESAASAQELNMQVEKLKAIISQFKFKNSDRITNGHTASIEKPRENIYSENIGKY